MFRPTSKNKLIAIAFALMPALAIGTLAWAANTYYDLDAGKIITNEITEITKALNVAGTATFSNAAYSALFTGGNVGIGTTAPGARLHVVGADNLESGIALNVTNASSTSALYVNNLGNVGIGTTAPAGKLDVHTTDYAQYLRWIVDSGTNSGAYSKLYSNNTYGALQLGGGGGNAILSNTTGGWNWSTQLNISGNVGIGTAAPGARLHVVGADNASTSVAFNVTNASSTSALYANNSGNVGIGTTGPASKLGVVVADGGTIVVGTSGSGTAGIEFNYSGRTGGNDRNIARIMGLTQTGGGGDLLFETAPSAGSAYETKMVIQRAGNVGIGTTNPYRPLSVANVNGIQTGNNLVSLSNGLVMVQDSSAHKLIGYENLPMSFFTNATEWMRISTSGNVGIGTTGPTGNLTVKGAGGAVNLAEFWGSNVTSPAVYVSSHGVNGSGLITTTNFDVADPVAGISEGAVLGFNGSPVNFYGVGVGTLRNSKYDVWFQTGAINGGGYRFYTGTSEKVTFDSAGNVGIGTTGPEYKLEVANVNGTFVKFSGVSSGLVFGADANGAIIQPATIDVLNINRSTGANAVTISSGNVGIGTTAPAVKLEIAGANVSQHGLLQITGSDVAQQTWYIGSTEHGQIYADGNQFLLGSVSAVPLVLRTQGIERVRILSEGNVGIGTTNPSSRLHVVGADISTSTVAQIGGLTGTGLVVLNNGNVGIGTTAPNVNLQISAAAVFQKLTWTDPTYYAQLAFTENATQMGAFTVLGSNYATTDARYAFSFNTHASGKYLFSIGGSEKVRIDNQGNVGIGTTAPLSKLELGSGQLSLPLGLVGTPSLSFTGDLDSGLWSSGADTLNFSVGGAEKVRISSSGNVGIGTTGPREKLDVRGNAFFGLMNAHESEGKLILGRSDGITLREHEIKVSNSSTQANNYLTFAIHNGTLGSTIDVLTLKGSGNVGIGTTAPGAKLEVSGITNVLPGIKISSDGVDQMFFDLETYNTSVARNYFTMRKAGGTAASPAIVANGDYTGMMQWQGYDGSIFRDLARIDVNVDGVPGSSDMPGRFMFSTTPDGSATPVERMRIDSSGNVGIGTTEPAYPLDVSGVLQATSIRSAGFYNPSSANNSGLQLLNTGANIARNIADANPVLFVQQVNPSSTGDILQLKNSASTVLTVQQSGNVGIGTTAPTAKLDVNAGAGVYSGEVARFGGKVSIGQSGTESGQLALRSTSGRYLTISETDTANSVISNSSGNITITPASSFIISTGNVGIGTTNPSAKLSVLGSDSLATTTVANLSGSTGTGLVVMADGKVGIGTTAPSDVLTVNGAIKSNSWIAANGASINSTNGLYYSAIAKGNYGFGTATATGAYPLSLSSGSATTYTDGYINLFTAGLERLRIDNAGNVGIGTTGPGAKLDVVTGDAIGLIIKETNNNQAANLFEVRRNTSDLITRLYESGDAGLMEIGYSGFNNGKVLINGGESGGGASMGLFNASNIKTVNLLSNGVSYFNSGNVGIGTTGPQFKLDVSGIIASGYGIGNGELRSYQVTDALNYISVKTDTGINKSGIYRAGGANNFPFYYNTSNGNVVQDAGFTGASNLFMIGGVEKMRVNNAGNVGIGTTGPAQRLAIVGSGTTASTASLNVMNASSTSALFVLDSGNVGIGTTGPGARLQVVGSDSLATSFAANLSGATGTGLVVLNSGNVGIGTTGPGTQFHVYGSTAGIKLERTGGNEGFIWLTDGTYSGQIRNLITENGLRFTGASGTPEWMRIQNNGNVGIGTTGPTGRLQVVGADDYSTTTAALIGGLSTTGLAVLNSGNVGIGTTGPAVPLQVNGQAMVGITGAAGVSRNMLTFNTYGPNYAQFYDLATVSTNKFYLGASSAIGTIPSTSIMTWDLSAGNVGIGTTGPDTNTKLDVNGVSKGTILWATDYVAAKTINASYLGTTQSLTLNSGSAGGDIIFGPRSGAEAMRILNSGNVGIGTTVPSSKLDVNGSITAAVNFYAGGNLYLGPNASIGSSSGIIAFKPADSEKVRIDSSGNVGIGTTSPSYKLDVNGTLNASATSTFAGRVGIGTTAPTVALEVKTTSGLSKFGSGSSGADIVLSSGGSVYASAVYNSSFGPRTDGGAFSFVDWNANPLMTILTAAGVTSGNVGIGTTSPLFKLDVAGTMNISATSTFLGRVGIGTTSPMYPLDVYASGTSTTARFNSGGNNNCTINATTGEIACSSDSRLKKNVEDLNYGLNEVMALRPVEFNWNREDAGISKSLGFIAQEVETVLPKLVITDQANGYKSLNTIGMVPVLAKAIQDQQKQIMSLKLVLDPEGALSNASSTPATAAVGGPFAWLANGLNSLGLALQDGVASLKEVVVDRFTAKELQMTDKATGEKYCTWIANGEWVKVKGECGSAVPLPTLPASGSVEQDPEEPSVPGTAIEPVVGSESHGDTETAGLAPNGGQLRERDAEPPAEVTQEQASEILKDIAGETVPAAEPPAPEPPAPEPPAAPVEAVPAESEMTNSQQPTTNE